jgi:sortase B
MKIKREIREIYEDKRDKIKLWCKKRCRFFKSHQINLRFIVILFLCVVFIFSATMLVLHYMRAAREDKAMQELAALIPTTVTDDNTVPAATATVLQSNQSPIILAQYREAHAQNTDMVGWIKIDGTRVDYPVMYTADDFYMFHGFDKKKSVSGVPFVDKRCAVDPFGTNSIIYGHNMKNGTMFADLVKYADQEYYRKHPIVQFDTLYEQQSFEIIAVFKSQTYRKSDNVFKHYNFLNADDAAAFDEYIANITALSLYDTGVTASYGDKLLTLVTCSYHTKNGQFVVVAKKLNDAYNLNSGTQLWALFSAKNLIKTAFALVQNGAS